MDFEFAPSTEASRPDGAVLPRGFLDEFCRIARAEPERLFATFGDEATRFGDLDRQSDAFANWCGERGLGFGSRIATMMDTHPRYLAVLLGIAKLGAVWIPVNTRQRGEGLRFVIESAGIHVFVLDSALEATLDAVAPAGLKRLIAGGGGGDDALEGVISRDAPAAVRVPDPSEVFAISFTSGTTGKPKAVPVTHAMLRYAGEAAALVADLADGDVLLMWEPLHHIGGAQMLVVPLVRRVHLAMVPRFSASSFWDSARAAGATRIHYLGGVLQILLKQPPSLQDRDHEVRVAWGGGCPADIWEAFEERFGVTIRECYGMTETSSIATYNGDRVVGSVGRPLPWFEVELRDPETGTITSHGEIVVRPRQGGALFSGYVDAPEATARALRGGALFTGDIGSWMAGGHLRFHGRQTDSVRVKGENVSAWEVERVVNTHPDIEDSAVIGVASDVGEADIKLFVQPRRAGGVVPAELWRWLSQRLAAFQLPRYIALVDGFPRTASERIMKHQLDRGLDGCWSAPERRHAGSEGDRPSPA